MNNSKIEPNLTVIYEFGVISVQSYSFDFMNSFDEKLKSLMWPSVSICSPHFFYEFRFSKFNRLFLNFQTGRVYILTVMMYLNQTQVPV